MPSTRLPKMRLVSLNAGLTQQVKRIRYTFSTRVAMTALSLLLVILVLMYLGGNLIRSVLTPLVILP